MYKSPRGKFQGPYCRGVGKQVHKETRAAPPITKLIRNQEETARYIIWACGA
jgi:hypothetical protein